MESNSREDKEQCDMKLLAIFVESAENYVQMGTDCFRGAIEEVERGRDWDDFGQEVGHFNPEPAAFQRC